MLWRRKRQPTLVFLPGKSHGQRRLVGYSPWGCKETRVSEHACIRTHTQVHVTTEMNLENLMLNEIHQSQKTAFCSTPWTQLSDWAHTFKWNVQKSQIHRYRKKKQLKAWEVTTNGYGASSRGDESVLKLDCNKGCNELSKTHWIAYFKWVNYVACELYLNEAFKQTSLHLKCHESNHSYWKYTARKQTTLVGMCI